jgi:outer membrane lipoprotein-sorting protein
MKKHYLPWLLCLLVAPVWVTQAATQTADEVVEKHLAAMGGREALGKLTSRKATGTITLTTPNGNLTGPVEMYTKVPNKVRAYIVLDLTPMGMNDKLTVDQKFDGTTGWTLDSMQGNNQITGNQLDNMKNAIFPSALLNYKAAGTTVELLPNETVAGKAAIVLRLTPKAGSVSKLFLDAVTYLPFRSTATINMPQMGGDIEQMGEASDYRTVDGVKVPFKSVNTTPLQTVTITLTTVEHNVPIDDAMFVVK